MELQCLQKGILDWFWLTPLEAKSLPSIENVCIKLYHQFLPDRLSKNAKYEIFFPLLRYGVIEFSGNNSYRLSPSCFLYSNRYILSCNNINENVSEQKSNSVFSSTLGLDLYERTTNEDSFSKRSTEFLPYHFRDILRSMPIFRTVINNWVTTSIIETKRFMYFSSKYSWVACPQELLLGVYKKSEEIYSQRTIMLDETVWKDVPNRSENIDAFNVACMWSHIENGWDLGIQYDMRYSKLRIRNVFFPFVIERQLFLNTLLEGALDFDFLNREYYLKQSEFILLNQLFSDQISMI